MKIVSIARSLLPSMLLGAIAGSRSMTPLAAVSIAAGLGALPRGNGAPRLLGHPAVVAGSVAMAVGELWGDKLKSAPDRIVPAGLVARAVTGAVAGMAMASRRHRDVAAAGGAAAAVGAAFPTFAGRMRSMRSHGQTPTGLVEDAIVVFATIAVVTVASRMTATPAEA